MTAPKEPLESLEELQHKIDEARTHSGSGQGSSEAPENNGRALRVGMEVMAGVGVGSVLGYFIDRWLDTAPIFLIVFLFLGFAAGIRNIIRMSNKDEV